MDDIIKIIMESTDPLEKKGKLFIYGIEDRLKSSLSIIRNEYNRYIEFKTSMNYIEYIHSETTKADLRQFAKLGYYPSTETEMELDHSIKHALIGSYKSSISDLRRGIELSVIFSYLSSEQVNRKKAKNWIKSKNNTPHFSNTIKELIKKGRYRKIEESCNWKQNIQELFWKLSNFCHNKGKIKGYRELNDTNFFTAGTSIPTIKKKSLKLFCDLYIKTVKEIVAIQSLYNPVILVGLPIYRKFGLNSPASGFCNDRQANLINKLIPKKYKSFFDDLVENDEEVESAIKYFSSLSDLTEEELKKQIERQNKDFNRYNNDD